MFPGKEKGFTFIELAFAILILGILAAIAIPKFTDFSDQTETQTCRHNIRLVASALQAYYGTAGEYPYASSKSRWRTISCLEEFLPGWEQLECPTTGAHYRFKITGTNYDEISIRGWNGSCKRNHGWINDGMPTWQ